MKKITEKQLVESARALRDYAQIVEAEQDPYYRLGQGDLSAIPDIYTNQPNAWDSPGTTQTAIDRAKQLYRGATNASSQRGTAAQQTPTTAQSNTNPIPGGILDTTFPNVQKGTAPQGTTQQSAKKWPETSDEIRAFQKANKLVPDAMIGNKTLAALKAAGYTPPQGFVPVANKATPTQRPLQQPIGPTQADQDEFMASNAADRDQYQSDMAAIKKALPQQSAAPAQGVQEAIRDTLEKLDELNLKGIGNAVEKGINYARTAGKNVLGGARGYPVTGVKKTSQELEKDVADKLTKGGPGSNLPPSEWKKATQSDRDIHNFGKALNTPGAAASALGGAGLAAYGMKGDDTIDTPLTGTQKPAGYYTDTTASDRMVKSTADAGRNALSKPVDGGKVEPSEIHTIKQPSVDNAKIPTQQKDPQVEKLQRGLVSKGYDIAVDGVMGQDTKNALMHYQEFGPGGASQMQEHVTFAPIDSLARIIQLSRI
jgi:hypothetical protein